MNKKTLLMLVTTCVFFEFSPSFAMDEPEKSVSLQRSGVPVHKKDLSELNELEKGFQNPQFLKFPQKLLGKNIDESTFTWRGIQFLVTKGWGDIEFGKTCYSDATLTYEEHRVQEGAVVDSPKELIVGYKCQYTSYLRLSEHDIILKKISHPEFLACPSRSECNWARQTLGIDMGDPLLNPNNVFNLKLHVDSRTAKCANSEDAQLSEFNLAHNIILLNQKAIQQRQAADLLQYQLENAGKTAKTATQLKEQNEKLEVQLKEIEKLKKEAEVRAEKAEKECLTLQQQMAKYGKIILPFNPGDVKLRSTGSTFLSEFKDESKDNTKQ